MTHVYMNVQLYQRTISPHQTMKLEMLPLPLHCFNSADRKELTVFKHNCACANTIIRNLHDATDPHSVEQENAIMALPADLLVGTVVAHLSKHPGVSHTRSIHHFQDNHHAIHTPDDHDVV